MNVNGMKKRFPAYFSNFTVPKQAHEQEIAVYRACPTRKIEQASFLNTYEENGGKISAGADPADPQQYCMSTEENPKNVRRFVVQSEKYNPPFALAKGVTSGKCGVSCRTKEWKKVNKNSTHVDYWLYEGSEPWTDFEEADYNAEQKAFAARRKSSIIH